MEAPTCTSTRAGTCAYRSEPNRDGNVQSVSDLIECPGHSNGTNAARSNPYGWERAERCEPNNRGERRIVLDRPYPNGFNPFGYGRSKISAVEIVRLGFDRVKILTRSNPPFGYDRFPYRARRYGNALQVDKSAKSLERGDVFKIFIFDRFFRRKIAEIVEISESIKIPSFWSESQNFKRGARDRTYRTVHSIPSSPFLRQNFR